MHAPPLVTFAGGACPTTASASPSPWLASPRDAIFAAPARPLRSRRGTLRLEAKAAWRAAGGGRGPRVPAKGAVLASYMGAEEVVGPSSLLDEEEFISHIRKELDNGKLPADVASNLEELYYNYRNAVLQNGDPNAYEVMLSNMMTLFDRVLLDVQNPFNFPPYHKALREPFDYYMFGQNYIRPLVDFRNSYVGNISLFHDIEENLHQGHNVVLMSNHQSEADPAIIALLLEKTNPWISENIVYVAGDRVVTDPLCKPFSMGRNLICVYSKKHMNDFPELIEMKRRSNTRSLKEMALLLRGGSQLIWIAPSGGRDRPNPSSGEWYPAPFDSSAVDNMRRLLEHAGVPGHIYPLSLLCYEVMPPPQQVEKEIGEQRVISFHGAGLSVTEEINYGDITAHTKNADEGRELFTNTLYNSVVNQYNVLKSAIFRDRGAAVSNNVISLSQPWR
ncbi:glycerol-3-phosphate acyltransferase isoform X1 [Zea mays]|uniref:Glycerol-3-phosphate acyltransferase, chloroplastic n=3 Tax=Zea mays TaxID=4577 RepID=B6U8X9_MAIZE|nr:glycerol-3-phosphate acyltransferase [Zea mays]XP_008643838.1 glycerol-3-phosphate acyltransferase isoform X1 [Zea mays]XP_008643839.1 glycerol-3-phosphate acyltransferase isoform X1 [Zea mays]XP_008643840.1 glycerol-3-phosphate acyltransferase isoform X1 [Zea mays]XP_035824000.1 glycerol-3-phosphate acyltransferase isoform X1 [Zea mays]ACG45812.1 glycerol-3-phosphate acyltransferase [Zea mays]AQK66220.1 Glycerol-3-phosphate acyltransferase [Zea mays]AQK66228.1 Glycerol-3-phosphate acyltr|eukprot:NP_001152109.1 glycerol-3-phosphate acyltransferase [Zea mays]